MSAWYLLVAVGLLLANAFYVAVEFALVASRRSTLEPLAAAGNRSARRALSAVGDLNFQLAGAQLGITMASLGLGAVAEPAIADVLAAAIEPIGDLPEGVVHGISFVIALAIVVFLHLVIGEMVPKSIAIAAPERVLMALSGLNRAYVVTFGPVIRLLNGLAGIGMWVLRVPQTDERVTVHSAEELARLLAESREGGFLAEEAHALMTGALGMQRRTLADVAVAATRVVAVGQGATVATAEGLVIEHGVSRLLVLDAADRPVGFVHAKDMLGLPPEARSRPLPLARIRRVLVLPEDMGLDEVLVGMQRARTHVAAVLGPAGDWTGLATLEDVLESVVGDIVDESDA